MFVRDASSKGRIDQGTNCSRDGTSETFRSGTHRHGIGEKAVALKKGLEWRMGDIVNMVTLKSRDRKNHVIGVRLFFSLQNSIYRMLSHQYKYI
jgi:hypothetical protein